MTARWKDNKNTFVFHIISCSEPFFIWAGLYFEENIVARIAVSSPRNVLVSTRSFTSFLKLLLESRAFAQKLIDYDISSEFVVFAFFAFFFFFLVVVFCFLLVFFLVCFWGDFGGHHCQYTTSIHFKSLFVCLLNRFVIVIFLLFLTTTFTVVIVILNATYIPNAEHSVK